MKCGYCEVLDLLEGEIGARRGRDGCVNGCGAYLGQTSSVSVTFGLGDVVSWCSGERNPVVGG